MTRLRRSPAALEIVEKLAETQTGTRLTLATRWTPRPIRSRRHPRAHAALDGRSRHTRTHILEYTDMGSIIHNLAAISPSRRSGIGKRHSLLALEFGLCCPRV